MIVEAVDCSGDLPGFISKQDVGLGNRDDPVLEVPTSFILAAPVAPTIS